MPQLDFGNPLLIAQVVWLLIIFGLLCYVMATYALPRVAEVLEHRDGRIRGDLEAAQAAKAEADAAMAAHREATAKARADAQSSIASAMQGAQAEAARRAETLNAKLAKQIEEAETRIAAARDAAMGALRQVSVDTTHNLVAKLTGQADATAVNAAVDKVLGARDALATRGS
ncbi:F0F1 ATP synthase subunit B' [Falsiroseomonas sp. HW251]|uniref:F0F1 ATP synthase subunit B family protein n=1 Tax=Falsiroseomonas sp. HW251 TaxID=3390998 RepID=UPI003D316563